MTALIAIAGSTFTQLRRDGVFIPVTIIGLAIAVFASLASQWSIDEFSRVLFDIGMTGYLLAGTAVAVLWGTRSVIDPENSGMEVELTAPISRPLWLLGKFLGLGMALTLFTLALAIIWQVVMALSGYGWLQSHHFIVFGFLLLGWLVTSAVAVLVSSFAQTSVAQFVTACLWLLGMVVASIAKTLLHDTNVILKAVVTYLAKVWDFQQLNLVTYASNPQNLSPQEIWLRFSYGSLLCVLLLTASCWILARRKTLG